MRLSGSFPFLGAVAPDPIKPSGFDIRH